VDAGAHPGSDVARHSPRLMTLGRTAGLSWLGAWWMPSDARPGEGITSLPKPAGRIGEGRLLRLAAPVGGRCPMPVRWRR
jgi:hypothetical protein